MNPNLTIIFSTKFYARIEKNPIISNTNLHLIPTIPYSAIIIRRSGVESIGDNKHIGSRYSKADEEAFDTRLWHELCRSRS